MRRSIVWGLVWLGFVAEPSLERVGRLDDPAIVEASGIVKSRQHPGIFWVHNDSGNPSALFAVRRDGSLVRSYKIEAPNVDWEDISIDDSGHLYLGDIGNNDNRLPLRMIYRLDEPDPTAPAPGVDKPLRPTAASFYGFPDKKARFDAEGLFIDRGKAFVVSKRFDGREAEVFAVRLDPPAPLIRPTLPERVAKLPGCVEPATGADLSPDGQLLAVVTTKAARVYRPEPGDGWSLIATVPFDAKHVEAICWDGFDLVLASEDRSIYRIAEEIWRNAPKPKPKKEASVGSAIADLADSRPGRRSAIADPTQAAATSKEAR
jgi:hypothetical protein